MFDTKNFATFNRRFLTTPEIVGYLCIAAVFAVWTLVRANNMGEALWPAVVTIALYPVAEYLLHRYLMHATFLARSPLTSPLWYRIHYRHHSRPSDQSVILAAPYTIVGAVMIIAALLALAFRSFTAFTAAMAAGGVLITAYEYAHSACHAAFATENRYLRSIRTSHVLHHFHSEGGNYGITNNLSDWLFGSRYDETTLPARSPTVRNLGYDEAMYKAFPWIGEIERAANERKARGECNPRRAS